MAVPHATGHYSSGMSIPLQTTAAGLVRAGRRGQAGHGCCAPPERSSRATASTRRCPRSPPPRARGSAASTASSPPSATCSRRSWSSVCRRPRIGATPRSRARHGPWSALTGLLWTLAERQAADDVLGEAMATGLRASGGAGALDGTTAALERLLAAARAEGRLRADATTLDLRLLFAATRAAGAARSQGAWRRMLELGIDALEAGAPGASSSAVP